MCVCVCVCVCVSVSGQEEGEVYMHSIALKGLKRQCECMLKPQLVVSPVIAGLALDKCDMAIGACGCCISFLAHFIRYLHYNIKKVRLRAVIFDSSSPMLKLLALTFCHIHIWSVMFMLAKQAASSQWLYIGLGFFNSQDVSGTIWINSCSV